MVLEEELPLYKLGYHVVELHTNSNDSESSDKAYSQTLLNDRDTAATYIKEEKCLVKDASFQKLHHKKEKEEHLVNLANDDDEVCTSDTDSKDNLPVHRSLDPTEEENCLIEKMCHNDAGIGMDLDSNQIIHNNLHSTL